MQKVIGYDESGKKIFEDRGPARGANMNKSRRKKGYTHLDKARLCHAIKQLVDITVDMPEYKRIKYLNKVQLNQMGVKDFRKKEHNNKKLVYGENISKKRRSC